VDGRPGRAERAADRAPGEAASEVRRTASVNLCPAAGGQARGQLSGAASRTGNGPAGGEVRRAATSQVRGAPGGEVSGAAGGQI